jgi:hypothetical protein
MEKQEKKLHKENHGKINIARKFGIICRKSPRWHSKICVRYILLMSEKCHKEITLNIKTYFCHHIFVWCCSFFL